VAKSLFDEYVGLYRERARLRAELEDVEARIAEMETRVVDTLADLGLEHAATPEGTVYIAEDIWASAVDHEALAKRLEEMGVEGIAPVRVNASKLSALVREWIREGGDVPEELRDLVRVSRQYRARVRQR
jgi:hypothetical protein